MIQVSESLKAELMTGAEFVLVQWLLMNGDADAAAYLPQLELAKVSSCCACGCASINFSICGERSENAGMKILSDFRWQDDRGNLFGAFVFACDSLLAGLEVWSIDGEAAPTILPSISLLVPFIKSPAV
ncbi:hypothetical protein ELE36_17785 [Pseudolysobacter antarcticus]|uniref:Uncharacterized protein n=1 Tax=Pseudolysobacter antarcticus TaxID=2511995 RepID=A0A411HNK9_9GAMM|nr:hypothetical protein [Pseudolysobacter antarcticus]QBB72067.1 hypothetical protein ELE36_17785 [Pseudolysobacter antarcticus]